MQDAPISHGTIARTATRPILAASCAMLLAVSALVAALAPARAQESSAMMKAPAPDRFCISNASEKPHYFAVETREGKRRFAALEPGEKLCSDPTSAKDGIVSVFASDDGFEGCSRIIPTGSLESMLEYAEFDRCRWGSRDN